MNPLAPSFTPSSASASSTRAGSEDPGCLVGMFNYLQLPDGSPNVPLRDANSRPGLDALPPELICFLVPQLQPDDFAACVQVSKRWRSCWTSQVVASDILNQTFPGLIQTAKRRGFMPNKLWTLFALAARKHWRFLCGSHRVRRRYPNRMNFFADDREFRLGRNDRGPLYSSGRVAWQLDPNSFVIDDLHAKTRDSLDCDWLQLVAITEKLVILTKKSRTGYPMKLVIHNISERRRIRLKLSSPVLQLQAGGLTIGLLLGEDDPDSPVGSPWVWRWGGELEKLRLSDASQERVSKFGSKDLTARGFFYHPWDQDSFFVVWSALEPEKDGNGAEGPRQRRGRCAVLVDEYKHAHSGSSPIGNFQFEFPFMFPERGIDRTLLGPYGSWCQETDFHGGNELFSIPEKHDHLPHNVFAYYTTFMFNTVTRSFFTEYGKRCRLHRPLVSPYNDLFRGPWVEVVPKELIRIVGAAPAPGREQGLMMACNEDFMILKARSFSGYLIWGYGKDLSSFGQRHSVTGTMSSS